MHNVVGVSVFPFLFVSVGALIGKYFCHCQAIKGNGDIIRLLAKMTKRTPDLSGEILCDDQGTTESRVWGQPYQGIRAPDGTPVQLKGIGFSKDNSIEVPSDPRSLPAVDVCLVFFH